MPTVRAGADKWKRRASAAQTDYTAGVRAPRRDWAEATRASSAAYTEGVQAAIAEGRFERGVTSESAQLYKQRAIDLGAQRYAQGISTSGDRYKKGFEPYRQTLEALELPARGRRGDPANLQRVQAVANALHEKKRGLQGT